MLNCAISSGVWQAPYRFVKASKDLDQATGVDVGERSRVLAEYGRPVSMG